MRRLLSSNRNLVHKFVIKDPVVVEIFELKVRGKVNKMVIYFDIALWLFVYNSLSSKSEKTWEILIENVSNIIGLKV